MDFAATHPDDTSRMVLAIETDGASYHQSRSVRDRDRLRGEHLQRLGWSFHRLWSTNWFQNPQAEVARLQDAYQRAVAATEPPRRTRRPRTRRPPSRQPPGRGPRHRRPLRCLRRDRARRSPPPCVNRDLARRGRRLSVFWRALRFPVGPLTNGELS